MLFPLAPWSPAPCLFPLFLTRMQLHSLSSYTMSIFLSSVLCHQPDRECRPCFLLNSVSSILPSCTGWLAAHAVQTLEELLLHYSRMALLIWTLPWESRSSHLLLSSLKGYRVSTDVSHGKPCWVCAVLEQLALEGTNTAHQLMESTLPLM